MGEKRKLTRDVPYFCNRNITIKTAAEIASTIAATHKSDKQKLRYIIYRKKLDTYNTIPHQFPEQKKPR